MTTRYDRGNLAEIGLIASCTAWLCMEQLQKLFNFLDLRLNEFLGKQLLRPVRGERKASEKRSLAFQYLEW